MEVGTVGVVGAGQMGSGIAHVAAASGFRVLLADQGALFLEKARPSIERTLEREVAKAKRTAEEKAEALRRITTCEDLAGFSEADCVIEAVVEDEAVKRDLFRRLDAICPEKTLFASNTSSISITRLAGATRRPERFIGMHFMNPVPLMGLVEVIRGISTSDETAAAILDLARAM